MLALYILVSPDLECYVVLQIHAIQNSDRPE